MTRVSTAGSYSSALLNLMNAQKQQENAQTRLSTQKVATDMAGFGRGAESLTALKAASGRVQGTSGVWALGDLAAWWDASRGRFHRNEHWTTTVDQSSIVACDILGADAPAPSVPYVWSDQFGMKIQTLGRTDLAEEVAQLHGTGMDGGPVKGTVVGYSAGGALVGVVGFGAPAKIVRYRAMIAEGAGMDAVLAQSDAATAVGG